MIKIIAHELGFVLVLFCVLPFWERLTTNWAFQKLFVLLICLRVPARESESLPGEKEITSHPRGGCQHSRSWSCRPLAVHWQLQAAIAFSAFMAVWGMIHWQVFDFTLCCFLQFPFIMLFFFSVFRYYYFLIANIYRW